MEDWFQQLLLHELILRSPCPTGALLGACLTSNSSFKSNFLARCFCTGARRSTSWLLASCSRHTDTTSWFMVTAGALWDRPDLLAGPRFSCCLHLLPLWPLQRSLRHASTKRNWKKVHQKIPTGLESQASPKAYLKSSPCQYISKLPLPCLHSPATTLN